MGFNLCKFTRLIPVLRDGKLELQAFAKYFGANLDKNQKL